MIPKEPKINEKFIMNIKGKDFVLYSGLLDLAHQKGIKSIHVEPVQYPTKDNGMEAICKAVVISSDGQEFTEIGDANPRNVNSMIREHILRMSATRAKARALRDLSNIGMTCLEELGDLEQIIGGNQSSKPKPKVEKPQPVMQERAEPDESQQNYEPETQQPERFNSNRESAQPKPNNKPVTSNSRKETTKDDNIQKTNEAKTGKAANSKTQKEEANPQQSKSGGNVSPIKQDAKMSIAQKNAIMSLAKRRGIAEDELSSMVADTFNLSGIDYLTSIDASSFIRQLQQAA
jgi:flagellar biosynthesis GTPase FlhF